MPAADAFDVIVVGGGPAGSVMGWSLARAGVRVAILERAVFPREKVCGDFVEPAGLRILDSMGCLADLKASDPLPITSTRVYYGPRLAYQGKVPYYDDAHGLPPHGYIVPRDILDTRLLERAEATGASVFQGCAAKVVRGTGGQMAVDAEIDGATRTLTARLIVGADGAESLVARSAGLWVHDPRHASVSQRAYVEGLNVEGGEATIWFDEDIYPGYGWMFPMSGGRANVGVGMLSESARRHGFTIPKAFADAIHRLRVRHPGCADLRVASRPMGGVVRMYGGAGPNHFDGGVLVGDAGCFVDPMTGEGITQGMESSLIASRTLLAALEQGRFDAAALSRFERDYRDYFDPAFLWLDFCAALMRNWHFRDFWLRATEHGFDRARADASFARVSGAAFGGLNLQPLSIIGQVWASLFAYAGGGAREMIGGLLIGRPLRARGLEGDIAAWARGWKASRDEDPAWHLAWLTDLVKKAARLPPALWPPGNPRVAGPLLSTGQRPQRSLVT